jgi:hypothetical protein
MIDNSTFNPNAFHRDTPACLWFSKQDALCIWDAEEVLQALGQWLDKGNETFNRYPKSEDGLGHLDIFCTTEEKAHKIRAKFQEMRGHV